MADLKQLESYKSDMSRFAQGISIAEKGLKSLGESQRLADIFIKKEVVRKMRTFFGLKTVLGGPPYLLYEMIDGFFNVSTNKKYLNVFLKSSYASFTGKAALITLVLTGI
jgi:hypothetical protein